MKKHSARALRSGPAIPELGRSCSSLTISTYRERLKLLLLFKWFSCCPRFGVKRPVGASNAIAGIQKLKHTLFSGVADGGKGCEPPHWQAKCKDRGPHLPCISVLTLLLVFSRLLFFFAFFERFSDCIPVIWDFSIAIHIQVHYCFSLFSECWPVGPFS